MFSKSLILSFSLFTSTLAAVAGVPGVLDVPFDKQYASTGSGHSGPAEERDLSSTLQNINRIYYGINYTYGTPPQKLSGQVDTGSSDIIIFSKTYPAAGDSPTFNNLTSSTYKYVKSGFGLRYGDFTYATGDYITDVLSFGGSTLVKGVTGGYATQGNVSQAVFGIGYPGNEARSYGTPNYANLPAQLKSQGLIAANAYSLYLNSELDTTGGILFGGVDSAKYTPPLVTLPLVSIDDDGNKTPSPIAFFVTVKAISVEQNSLSAKSVGSALLDSGTTVTVLDPNFVSSLAQLLGFTAYDFGSGPIYLSSSPPTKSVVVDYKFSNNLTIKVQSAQFVREIDGFYQLLLAPRPSYFTFDILGDSFLSSAYVVYDLDNNQVALAQSVWGSTKTSIKAIPAGPGAIPGAVAAT